VVGYVVEPEYKGEHMSLIKVGTPVANTTTTAVSPDVAALMAQLAAAQAALAAESARADAAEKAKGAPRGYSAKVSEKGCVSIYGVSARFPVTLYAPHFVGIALDLILTDKGVAFLRENADRLSVKVDGAGTAGTDASRAEVLRLADRLEAVVAKVK
jgi:hypothetical protein